MYLLYTTLVRNTAFTLNSSVLALKKFRIMGFFLPCFFLANHYMLNVERWQLKRGKKKKGNTKRIVALFPPFFKTTSLTWSSDSKLPKGRQSCKIFQVWFHRGIISVQLNDEVAYPYLAKNRTSHCPAIIAL